MTTNSAWTRDTIAEGSPRGSSLPPMQSGPAFEGPGREAFERPPRTADLVLRARLAWRSLRELGSWRELQNADPMARPLRELLEVVPRLCDQVALLDSKARPAPGSIGRLLSHEISAGVESLARQVEEPAAGESSIRPLLDRMRLLSEAARHLDIPSEKSPSASLLALAGMVAHDHRPEAAERGLEIRLAGDLPSDRVDAVRTRLVLDHLVANGIRHRDGVGGTVRISAAPVLARPGWLRVIVGDDGRGIAVEQAGRLFERLFEDPATDSDRAPQRLGLRICRWATEQMGGRISLQSSPGSGTTVTFTVPTRD